MVSERNQFDKLVAKRNRLLDRNLDKEVKKRGLRGTVQFKQLNIKELPRDIQDLILERNIRLNICPQSNIALGAVKNLEAHPLRKLFDKGIKVTVNTDDLILFNTTVTDELYNLYTNNIFSFDELEIIRKNGF